MQKFLILLTVCTLITESVFAAIVRIPDDFTTIQEGIDDASSGDTILIAPGTYYGNFVVTKALTIGSEFLLTGEVSVLSETIIDGRMGTVFTITDPKDTRSTITGLTIRNGEDGFMVSAPVNLVNNIILNCVDGIDYETGGGGLCRNNQILYNGDDGIDLDGTLDHLVIENNIVSYNVDDGIEIRLHSYTGETAYCKISGNQISHNFEDGIQFIDYPDTSSRIYVIERNLIHDNRMAGYRYQRTGYNLQRYPNCGDLRRDSNNRICIHLPGRKVQRMGPERAVYRYPYSGEWLR